jgi:ligand-binding sensor protein
MPKYEKPIAEKGRVQKGTFYGMCHAGVEEYIVPIACNGQLIGTINTGVFCSHTKVGERFVKRISQSSALNETTLLKLYYSSLNMKVPGIEKINSLLGIAAEYYFQKYAVNHQLSSEKISNPVRILIKTTL